MHDFWILCFTSLNVMYQFHILKVTMTDAYVRVLDILLIYTMLPDDVFIVVGSLWPRCQSFLVEIGYLMQEAFHSTHGENCC